MNDGFFSKKETESVSRPDGKTYSCISCGLFKDCKSPKMQPFGNFKKKILNIGEAPGEWEDKNGRPWQGRAGKLLQRSYEKLGIDLFEDCLNINAVHCRPMDKDGEDRTPTNLEIESCRRTTLQIIKDYKPNVIILFGFIPIYSIIGHRWKKDLGSINKWRGFTIPDQDFMSWVCPTFHPSYIEKAKDGPEEAVWLGDLKQIVDKIDKPVPIYQEPNIEIIEDLSVLDHIMAGPIAFDYETTGLKPHGEGHRIVSCAIADSADHAYSFLMPNTRQGREPLVRLLNNEYIEKWAHNMKFEDEWTTVRLKTNVVWWDWDSMLAAHVLDNRDGVTSLKFQSYVQFGIVDYASEISPYLSADKKNANSINTIFKLLETPAGVKKLLTYGGYDAINEYRLCYQQKIIMDCLLPF
jgi:uracil-DNA glycosylase